MSSLIKYTHTHFTTGLLSIFFSIVEKLLDSNPSLLKKVDNKRKNPLHLACQHGHLTVVQNILESPHYSKCILEACDEQDNSSMHLACMKGSSGIVKLLIDKGAKTNTTNVNKRTPLHTAAECGYVDVVTILVQKQKDSEPINCWDDCKRTPLHLAAKNSHVDVVKYLHKYVQPESKHFHLFITYAHISPSYIFTHSQLQQTIDTNIPDLHAEDKFRHTPVVLAAEANSRDAFAFFMNCIGENGIKDVTKNPLFQALNLHDETPQAVKVIVMKVHSFCSSSTHLSGKFL